MPKYLGNVRCWVNSGKHMLALSFSGFDPEQTFDWLGKPMRVDLQAGPNLVIR